MHGLFLFQVWSRTGRVDPFVVGVTNRYEKSSVPTFLLETYFAQITGIEKEGFMKYTPGIKGSKTATEQTKTAEAARHQFVTSVNLLKG